MPELAPKVVPLIAGDLEFYVEWHELCCGKKSVILSPNQTIVLETIMRAKGRIITLELFEDAVYKGMPTQVKTLENMRVYIHGVRTKFLILGSNVRIKYIWRVGYRLVVPD